MLGFIYRAWADLNRRLKNYPAAMEWIQRAEGLAEEETEITRALDRVFEGTLLRGDGPFRGRINNPAGGGGGAGVRAQAPAATVAGSHFLLARSLFRSGNSPQAEASLRKSFDLSFAGGSDQNLVREAAAAADLLAAFTPHPVLGGYCVSLIERSGRQLRGGRTGELPAPAAEPMALEVKALGTLEISWSGSSIPRSAWTSQKTKEVFLYLVDRSPVAREDLLSVFWPEMPAGRALANLYQTLYRIRRAVGADILLLRDQVCRFAENITVAYDVSAFEKSAREALARPVTDRTAADRVGEGGRPVPRGIPEGCSGGLGKPAPGGDQPAVPDRDPRSGGRMHFALP